MNGTHRPTGVLLLNQPPHTARAHLQDVAPTVLSVLGVAAPPMDGRPLLGAGATATPPPAATPPDERDYTPEQAAAMEERLRQLGYLA